VITHLFVYGTLRPGQERWGHLAPFVVDDGHYDTVPGAVYDTLHGYPAARFDRPGSIQGRRYELRVDRFDECLQLLDEVEAVVVDLFRRVVVRTSAGFDAWAYEYCGEPRFPEIASGDWLSRSA
jgi:gamma-glutamylcyclotransferase (GGCT)/AIG2-like uncharacterized protein YtfP